MPAYELDWSSKGRIAFVRAGNQDFYTVSGRGGPVRRLTRCGCVNEASWSPEGLRLIFYRFVRGTSRSDVFVMDANGSNMRRIVRGGRSPVWSPDGRKIALTRGGGVRDAQVVIAQPDGSGLRVAYKIRAEVGGGISDLAWQARLRHRR